MSSPAQGPQPEQIREALKNVKYPGFSRDVVSFGLVADITAADGVATVVMEHSIKDAQTVEQIRRDCEAALEAIPGVRQGVVQMRVKGAPAAGPAPGPGRPTDPFAGRTPLPGVKHIVAVASAKGGVGKSTVATNLAITLQRSGLKVGLMDADIYGPSLPTMMGVAEKPEITDERKVIPLERDGMKLMSIGFLVPQEKAMIWRGPMVMSAVQQFLRDVLWGELDVLVVDMPPGTGDAQLTLVQQVPLSGVVMVTTPQQVAVIDVIRGIQMFQETKAPVVGVVENMSGFACSHCNEVTDIFGRDGGRRTSERFGVPFLGAIPIEPAVVAAGDRGRPVVVDAPDSAAAAAFREVADGVMRFLEARAQSAAH